MSKRSSFISGSTLLVPAAVALLAVQAQAATFFDVQFTTDTTAGAVIGWTAATAGVTSSKPSRAYEGGATATVRAALGYTDTNTSNTIGGAGNPVAVLKDTHTTWSPSIEFKNAATEEVSSGKVKITMDILLDTVSATSGYSFFSIKNLANQNIGGVVINYNGSAKLSGFATVNGTNSYSSGSLTAAAGTVLHMDYEADLDSLTQTVSFDNGVHSLTGALPTGSAYGQLVVNPAGSTPLGTMAIDNINISSVPVPEPTGLALLGLGGLLTLRRRGAESRA